MIKLTKIINEVKSSIAYHVAETDVRHSIQKYGLDPNKYTSGDRTTGGDYIYIFLDYDEAYWYAKAYNDFLRRQDEEEKEFDIWKINTENLKLIKDFTLNIGDDSMKDSAYMVKSPIDKKQLKLIKTI